MRRKKEGNGLKRSLVGKRRNDDVDKKMIKEKNVEKGKPKKKAARRIIDRKAIEKGRVTRTSKKERNSNIFF